VQWVGPYQPDELRARMAAVDWVVVPSIWWENSPMVIQEAMVHGRPLLVSDIGGMREKVRDGVDGYRIAARNPTAWSAAMQLSARLDQPGWTALAQNIRRPEGHQDCAMRHLILIHQPLQEESAHFA